MINTVRILAWLSLAAIAFVTISPINLRPETPAPADVERFVAFAVCGGLFCLGYPRRWKSIAVGLVLAAGVLELSQLVVPTRHAQVLDVVFKMMGAVAGVATMELLRRLLQSKPSRPTVSETRPSIGRDR